METLEVEQQRPEMNMFCPSTTLIEGKRATNSSCQPITSWFCLIASRYFFLKKGIEQQGFSWQTQGMIPNWSHHTPLVIGWPDMRHNARTECRYMFDTMVIQGDTWGDTGEIWSRWRGQTIYGEARHQQMRNRMAYHGCCKIISICSADYLETIKATIRDHCWSLRATAGVDDLWNILWPISIWPHAPAIDCTPFAFSNQI